MAKKTSEWVQPYRGPFTQKEATQIANELQRSPLIKDSLIKARDSVHVGKKEWSKCEWDVLVEFNNEDLK